MNTTERGPAFAAGRAPAPADEARADRGLERWRAALSSLGDPATADEAARLLAQPGCARLLRGVFGNSPFLTSAMELEPAFGVALLRDGPDPARDRIMSDVAIVSREAAGGVDPRRSLRVGKRRLALTAALADIAGLWPLDRVTQALSDFAEAALDAALAWLLAEAHRRGVLRLAEPEHPTRRSGLIVLGLGKLGARELNYSSDIDIVVFYDAERLQGPAPDTLQREAVRLTRGLVKLMAERTADGYVFRTDLRLRPDPGATPVAISTLAAEEYYETLGQNWERAALIKARPVAGDREAGAHFLRHLVPFVWRKNLDFAAIQDIHSIKRQINAHRGGSRIAIAGHNVKLGRGGIREIEFFAQTQQLIWGGRLPQLRVDGTVPALAALVRCGKIDAVVGEEMTAAYRYLRRLEHRLQMIDDAQTHTLPDEPGKLAALAVFLGYPGLEAFKAELLAALRTVEMHYAELFEDAPALTSPDAVGGNLVFTGGDPDPDTLATLERLGFANAQVVDASVRGWHHGRCRAMRSTRARELLTELMPHLLQALAAKPDPDAAFLAFDRFLNGLPAGVQLFSMFHANPTLLALVTDILGVAPALADHLARRPSVLESVLSATDFFAPPPPVADLVRELDAVLELARDAEDRLDLSRRWAHDRRFQTGVLALKSLLDVRESTAAWSRIAEAALVCLLPHVEADFARVHGRVPGCGMAVLGMGKLGGREMTATSDLDLIFVYGPSDEGGSDSGDDPAAVSDGPRPLPAAQYFARLSQRLIAAITAPTAEGRLYQVDMRLRPSGKAGPIAVSVGAFARYQREDAWVWEQMALTRARAVAGPSPLRARLERIVRALLTRHRDPSAVVVAVDEMRTRMAAELGPGSLWEPKHLRGGLVDIEFVAQASQLVHAHRHPGVLSPNTREALLRLRAEGVLDAGVAGDLIGALELWQAVQSRVRLCLGEAFDAGSDDAVPRSLQLAVEGLGSGVETLVSQLRSTAARVHAHYRRLVEAPSAAARDAW